MNVIPLILICGVGLTMGIVLYLTHRHRAATIRALAIRYGFHYLGTALPRSLTLGGTPFDRTSSVWNVIDGEPRGIRMVAFDCRVGVGKGSWCRTVIAVESDGDVLSPVAFNCDMAIDRSGRWKVLYRPKGLFTTRTGGLMPIEELDAYVKAFVG
jgi:hypothetical protein